MGGQSIPKFDYDLAPYVAKSFITNICEYLDDNEISESTIKNIKEQLEILREQSSSLMSENTLNIIKDIIEENILNNSTLASSCIKKAIKRTNRDTYQAMEALIHNLNTMNSRAGAQVPFSSINLGTDTSPEGRMIIKNFLLAQDAGLGDGETPIFPISIFKTVEGINYNPEDPNYDLFKLACKVSAKRLFPNFSFPLSPFNAPFYKADNPDTEIAYMGCRTRVISDITDPDNQIVTGRGNLSFTSINLPRLAIESNGNIDKFYQSLDEIMEIVKNQLLHRYKIQCNKTIKNYPFLMGQGAWMHSDELGIDDNLESVLKHGTLSIGFIGLAETLKALIGKHHGESETAQKLGLEIIKHMRDYTDKMSTEYNLNFSLLATPAEGLCLAGDTLVQTPYGNVPIKDIKDGDLVFSYNLDTNKVELDTVAKSWMTSPSRQVMKITFDTGQEVVCTPNHPFAVRKICRGEHGKVVSVNGSNEYIEFVNAENLEVGMRIKSNYIESSASGHLRFKNTDQYIHKMVYEHFTNQPIPNGYVVHHKDENELNNYFDNLELLSDKEHRIHHLKDTIGKYQYKSENVMGKDNPFYGKHHSDETKQLIRDSKKLNNFKFELVSAYYSGSTYKDLAEKYDVSTKAICNKLKQCGVVLQKNHIITKIEYLDEPIPVYDLTMTKNSNFFVGGNRGILVHNSGRFVKMDKERFGIIEGVTDRDYYTNSSHK